MNGELPLPPSSLTDLSVSCFSITCVSEDQSVVLILSQANSSLFALDLFLSFPLRVHSTRPPPLTSILSLILFPSPQHLSKFSYAPSWARGRLFWLHFPLWFLFSLSFLHHLCLWWYCLENTITSYQFHVLFLCTIPLLSVFWLYHLNITRFSVTT